MLGVEGPGWQDAKTEEYLHFFSFRNPARRAVGRLDASEHKM